MNVEEARAKLDELHRLRSEITRLTAQRQALAAPRSTLVHRCRRNFGTFCEYVLRDQLTGKRVQLAQHHWQWIRHVGEAWRRGLFPIVMAPAGGGKTSIMEGLALFLLGHNPSLRIKIVSSTDDNARERLKTCQRYIEDSGEYQEVFPHVRRDPNASWTGHKLTIMRPVIARDASITAISIIGTSAGPRADILLLDDINDARNTIQQPSTREKIWQTYTGVLLSRLDVGGLVFGICTRWSEHDLVGKIMADETMRERYAFLIQRVNEDFTALDTEQIFGSGEAIAAPPVTLDTLFDQAEAGIF